MLSAIKEDRIPHAYLFVGPDGVGKKTAALRWAKLLNCRRPVTPLEACEACPGCRKISAFNHPDVLWMNFEYQAQLLKEPVEKQKALKIDTVREMERSLRMKPFEAQRKIVILDPAESLVEAAAHALLKILEEPPPNTHLVLIAADAGQLLGTIRSRCQWVRFRPLPLRDIVGFLKMKEAGITEDAAQTAALGSEGSPGRALALLQEGEELDFDWESASLSELLSFCEQFQNPRVAREAAERFLRRLLARFQAELHQGRRRPESLRRALDALHQLKQNVTPQLIIEALLLRIRWDDRQRKPRMV
ncbi:MAG: DNA polymerase III subunit delta' [Elusimicrobia bacterium]|nr:DNA polymerase III subunit delta' [Elusimicrobiota bacterium]